MLWIILILVTSAVNAQAITSQAMDFTGTIGGTARFSCNVDFDQSGEMVTWVFNSNPVYSYQDGVEDYPMNQEKYSVTRVDNIFTLEVKNLESGDGGQYTCRWSGGDATAALVVLSTPQLSTSTTTLEEGSTAQYTCSAEFTGPSKEDISPEHYPVLRMSFDGVPLTGKVTEDALRGSDTSYNLKQVNNITFEASMDGKELVCDIGTSTPRMHVNVTRKVIVPYAVRNITYVPVHGKYGIGMKIDCTAHGNPKPEFTWDDLVHLGNSIDGQTLQITEQMLGSNSWRCTAENTVSGRFHQETIFAVFDVEESDPTVPGNDLWWIILLAVGAGLIVVILVGLTVYCLVRRNSKNKKSEKVTQYTPLSQRQEPVSLNSMQPLSEHDGVTSADGNEAPKTIQFAPLTPILEDEKQDAVSGNKALKEQKETDAKEFSPEHVTQKSADGSSENV